MAAVLAASVETEESGPMNSSAAALRPCSDCVMRGPLGVGLAPIGPSIACGNVVKGVAPDVMVCDELRALVVPPSAAAAAGAWRLLLVLVA